MPTSHSLPLYVQISEMLIRDIQAGRVPDGSRLPPEREMAGDLGISVGTLRKALADLTERGLLERRQGSGNYVRLAPGAAGVYAFFRLERVEGGGLPTARLVSVDRMEKPAHLPDYGRSPQAHRIRRVRSLGGTPVALEEIWLDGAVTPALRAADLSESLYLFYKERLGLWIQRVEDRIGAAPPPDWAAGGVGFTKHTCTRVDRLSWDGREEIVEFSQTWFDSEKARYVSRLR